MPTVRRLEKKKGYVPNAPKDASFAPNYGARLGSVIGEGIQSFANAIGFGEYNIQQNSCLKMIDMGTSPPRVRNTNRGEAMIVNHREYLGELVTGAGTPTAFTLQTYAINPGNSTLFPFCARLAQNFQVGNKGYALELKSEASNTATSLSLGSMFAAVDYNSLDAAPVSKVELENMEYACSNKPTDSIIMPIECARKNDVLTHLYIANDSDYLTGDKRLYDLGNLFVGSYGCPVANSPIAEIWITYEIALLNLIFMFLFHLLSLLLRFMPIFMDLLLITPDHLLELWEEIHVYLLPIMALLLFVMILLLQDIFLLICFGVHKELLLLQNLLLLMYRDHLLLAMEQFLPLLGLV